MISQPTDVLPKPPDPPDPEDDCDECGGDREVMSHSRGGEGFVPCPECRGDRH